MNKFRFEFLKDECWWGGSAIDGKYYPLTEKSKLKGNFFVFADNQTMPFFVSNKGRYIWSDDPFKFYVHNGIFEFEGSNVVIYKAGECLREAYLSAMKAHFPFNGRKLKREFFETAQYNTWMEYTYNPTQDKVLEYAENIINNGFNPGILIIDEGWHGRYGLWEFDLYKFPNPKEMIDKLHKMGFKVLLWIVPAVTADGQDFAVSAFEELNYTEKKQNNYLRNADGEIAIVKWWNGYSAVLDLRKQADVNFLDKKLKKLIENYGVDGFKFDGGSVDMYAGENIINGVPAAGHDAIALNIAWNDFGLKYDFHEYKDTFKGGGKNSIQRVRDRGHRWDVDGINTLIPCMITQGLLGMPFICPDMVGGGEWSYTIMPNFKIDEELFVRMAQVSALCPMMQFSWAPWKVLSEKNLKYVVDAAKLHKKMSKKIMDVISDSEISGEPVIRNLEYNDPGQGYSGIVDEFMVGINILVAPVVDKNTYERRVVFPEGLWRDSDGNEYKGRRVYTLSSPIDKLLWFERVQF